MPWQRLVMERGGEVDSDGLLWYRELVIVVPRQSGKTTLIVPWGTHRVMAWPERQVVLYTAQSRIKAREKWLEDQVYLIQKSPFRKLMQPNRAGKLEPNLAHGEEHMKFITGSKWGIDAPTETAGHGSTLDLGIIDEAFSQVDARVEQGMSPAMITRADSQKLVISTAGKSKKRSSFLWSKVEAGRNRVAAGLDSRTLYVEFSAPDDSDWLDPLTWAQAMPALGHTVTEDKVKAEADSLGEMEFRRAYLNQWRDELTGDWKIPESFWNERADVESSIDPGSPPVWSLDISPERSHASISVAGLRADGLIHLEVIESKPGMNWTVDRLAQLVADHGGTVYVDHVTVGALVPDLQAAGLEPVLMATADVKVSAAALFDAVVSTGTVRHLDQWELTEALAGAATRKIGDGWAWSRGPSMNDITALVAVTNAFWMLKKTLPDLNYDPLAGIG
jgi:phage terminase large subunit-like protein